jgi:hypothetical protein
MGSRSLQGQPPLKPKPPPPDPSGRHQNLRIAPEVAEVIPHLGASILELKLVDGQALTTGKVDSTYAFLPAPVTWVELVHEGSTPGAAIRVGYLLEDVGEGLIAGMLFVATSTRGSFCKLAELALAHRDGDDAGQLKTMPALLSCVSEDMNKNLQLDVHPILAIINSPRIVKRATRQPHSGFAREISKTRGIELAPWHEIKLQVTPPDLTDEEIKSGGFRFSKGKALHFCRAHLRSWKGRLILVSAHWRCDPELGTSRATYRAVA